MKADIFKNRKLAVCFISTLIWGLIGHAYMFLSSNFSHDSLNAFYVGEAETKWKIAVGRFMVIPARTLFGNICLPWVYGVASLLLIAVATYFIVNLFELNSTTYIVLSAGVLTVNITVTAMTATYLYELPYDMLAMLCAVMSVYFMIKHETFFQKYVISVLLVIVCLGLYQSYICVAFVLITLYSVNRLYKTEGNDIKVIKKELLFLVKSVFVFLIGIIFYFVENKLICSITGISSRNNFNFMEEVKNNLVKNIVHVYLKVGRRIVLPYHVFPTAIIVIISIAIIFIGVFYLLKRLITTKSGFLKYIFILLIMLALPIIMNFFGVINYYGHDLMLYAVFIIYPFIFSVVENSDNAVNNKINIFLVICVFLLLWNNILVANTCYMKKDIENKATLSLMTRVVYDLDKREDYIIGETPIVFEGYGPFEWCLEGFEDYSEITGMYFRSSATFSVDWYFDVYKAYFNYVLNYPMVSVDKETYEDCHEYVLESNMAIYPYEGYIVNHNGVLIINLGIR